MSCILMLIKNGRISAIYCSCAGTTERRIMKYRKKPVIIEAIQWDDNTTEIKNFCGSACTYEVEDCAWQVGKGAAHEILIIHTFEGDMIASRGDYIIKGINGEYYPCKPDIFEKIYEKVE